MCYPQHGAALRARVQEDPEEESVGVPSLSGSPWSESGFPDDLVASRVTGRLDPLVAVDRLAPASPALRLSRDLKVRDKGFAYLKVPVDSA